MIKENAIHRLLLLRHRKGNTELLNESLDMAIEALRQPERKPGKWVNNIHDIPICNQCGYMTPYDRAIDDYEYGNFCPNCGADMRGVAHENQKD